MRYWSSRLFGIVAALSLTGCLWGPGKFQSDLLLRKDGRFVLDYKGELLMQIPDQPGSAAPMWKDSMARCFADGRQPEIVATTPATGSGEGLRPCTRAELAKLKAQHEKEAGEQALRQRKEAERVAAIFGLSGMDDESNRQFAAKLMKYEGWRSVAYRGKGVFVVDYHFEGSLAQDFAFPLMPGSDMVLPFVAIRRRSDGSVLVTAPAFTGGTGPLGVRAAGLGMPSSNEGPPSRASGAFAITTDGEILTNNSEDGPSSSAGKRQLRWNVSPASNRIPEALIKL